MSGDFELQDEPILFYSDEMTATKLIALRHRGIKLHLYSRIMNKLEELVRQRSNKTLLKKMNFALIKLKKIN